MKKLIGIYQSSRTHGAEHECVMDSIQSHPSPS